MGEAEVKYQIAQCFFCLNFNPALGRGTAIDTIEASKAHIRIWFVLILSGPPGLSDSVRVCVTIPKAGKEIASDPMTFTFTEDGLAIVTMSWDAMPLHAVGPVSGQILFPGEKIATAAAGFHVVPPLTLAQGSATVQ
jgi:hypothetical protein